ncbi:MAG: sugar transporter substrate-binding protein [Cryobacterium sp.]|jgi:multiple sugar transport system substrate-binding protein|nr:sugar transporter substrate-binding protein [Cryobacterium sp.]
MKKRQKALLAIVVTASVTTLAGCGGGGGETADASFTNEASGDMKAWGFDNADEVGTSRLDYAESELKDVTIKIDQTTFDAQKFTTRVASGDVPDAVQMDRQYVGTYAAQGLIQPLDECYSANDVDPDSQYYPSVIDDVTYDGKVWAVPQFYQPPAIMLNKRVMDAAGVTAADIDTSKPDVLLAAVKKMYKESGGNPATLGFDPVGVNQAGLWLLGYGGQLMDEEGVPALDDAKNAAAIGFLKELMDAQGGYAKVKSFTDSFDTFGDQNPYVADQVAAQVNPQWYVNVLTPYVSGVNIEAVPFKDQSGKNFTVASGTSFVIPAGAKNADAACSWMLKLTSQDAWLAAGAARAKTIADTPGAINTGLFTGSPSADEAIRTEYVKTSGNPGFDQTIATYYDVVGEGQSFGASPAGQEIQSELKNAVTSVLLGDKTPEKALADAQTAAMRAYDKAVGK